MSEFLLSLRLLRGGGKSGFVRLALTAFGLALGVTVALTVIMLPSVLDERSQVVSNRQLLTAVDGTVSRFDARSVPGMWNNARFTRILVGKATDAPPPPGVSHLPGPGEVVLSHAARDLAAHDRGFAALVPGRVVGAIGSAGLVGPDELYAYVGVSGGDTGHLVPSRGWGGSGFDQTTRSQFSAVPWQLALIVLGPLAVYLTVCARLSASTRRRRYAALRLIGMSRKQLRRIAAGESAVIGAVGALLGVLIDDVVNRSLGPSGIMGFTWYPATSQVSGAVAAGVVLVVAVAGGIGGARTAWRAVSDPIRARFDSADRPVRWWATLPFAVGAALMCALLAPGRGNVAMSGRFAVVLVCGVALATVGLLPAVRHLSLAAARKLAVAGPTPSFRIAARRVECGASGLVSHISGLCLLVLAASIGSAILVQNAEAAVPATANVVVHINANEVPSTALGAMTGLPSADRWVVQDSVTEPPTPGGGQPSLDDYIRILGVKRVFIDCQGLEAETQTKLPNCQNGRNYRLAFATDTSAPVLAPGKKIRYTDGELTAPDASFVLPQSGPLPQGLVIATTVDARARSSWPEESTFYYHLAPDVRALDKFATNLSRVAPSATMNVFDLDLDNIETYRVERGTIGSGIAMAFMLALAGFLVSAASRAHERRLDNVALSVLGMRRKNLRATERIQLLLPLVIALPLAIATGWLSANTLLLADRRRSGWYFGSMEYTALLSAVALAAAWAVGTTIAGSRLRSEDLRRE
jgi:hypothetical protein